MDSLDKRTTSRRIAIDLPLTWKSGANIQRRQDERWFASAIVAATERHDNAVHRFVGRCVCPLGWTMAVLQDCSWWPVCVCVHVSMNACYTECACVLIPTAVNTLWKGTKRK